MLRVDECSNEDPGPLPGPRDQIITCAVDSYHCVYNQDQSFEIHSPLVPQVIVPVPEHAEKRPYSIEQTIESY